MRVWPVLFLVEGVAVMIQAITIGPFFSGFAASILLLVASLWSEYDANLKAREAWLRKAKIRHAELYYCEPRNLKSEASKQ
jgi:hypothetical protein